MPRWMSVLRSVFLVQYSVFIHPSIAIEHPLHGAPGQFRAVLQIELLFDLLAVGLDRLPAEFQPAGDLKRGESLPDHLEDLQLAVGKTLKRALLRRAASQRSMEYHIA